MEKSKNYIKKDGRWNYICNSVRSGTHQVDITLTHPQIVIGMRFHIAPVATDLENLFCRRDFWSIEREVIHFSACSQIHKSCVYVVFNTNNNYKWI